MFSGSKRELQDRIDELVGLSWEQFRRAVILPQGSLPPSSSSADERSALLERMTGTELYPPSRFRLMNGRGSEQQKLAAISQRLGDVALMDEATREQWVSQQISLATSLKHEQQQQQLMQDLRDLNGRIAAQSQVCQGGRGGPCRGEAAHGAAAPSAREFARAEQAQVARADHDELARLTPGCSSRRRRWPSLVPNWQAGGADPSRAPSPNSSAAGGEDRRRARVAPCNPSRAAQEPTPGIREKQQQLQKIQQEGARRSGKSS